MKYSEIKRALNSAAVNPKTDPMMGVVADIDDGDYFVHRAIEELRMAAMEPNCTAHDKHLTMALTLIAMAKVKNGT